MTHRLFLATAAWLTLIAATHAASDYAELGRTLAVEPDYRTDHPEYALLLFGPRAELRVWAVLDGDALYLDRNGDGDLTAPNERFPNHADCRGVTIAAAAGATFVINGVSRIETEMDGRPERLLLVNVEITGPPTYRQYCGVRLRNSAARAHLAHFGGPLRIVPGSDSGQPGPEHVLKIGEPVELDAIVGTIEADYGCWTAVEVERGGKPAFPEGVFPCVDIEFPARGGGAPIKQTFPLSGYC